MSAMFVFQIFLSDLHALSILLLNNDSITMQAYGRYDFAATANDELSFQKGAVLKVWLFVSPCGRWHIASS